MSDDSAVSDETTPEKHPLPEINPTNRPFWQGARDGKLVVQQCTSCESVVYPPRIACPHCFADVEWIESEGTGKVFTYGVVHRPSKPQVFDQRAPLITAVIELTEGGKILTNLVECDPEDVQIGMEVRVLFEEIAEQISIPQFTPVDS